MDVRIQFEEAPTDETSGCLADLEEWLRESEIVAKPDRSAPRPGVKGGLILGLAIAGVALSAIRVLISAIATWGSKRNYSISFKSGDTTFSANNLTAKQARAVVDVMKDNATASNILILISRR